MGKKTGNRGKTPLHSEDLTAKKIVKCDNIQDVIKSRLI